MRVVRSEIDVEAPLRHVRFVLTALPEFERWYPDARNGRKVSCRVPRIGRRAVRLDVTTGTEREEGVVTIRCSLLGVTIIEHLLTLRPAGPDRTVVRHVERLLTPWSRLVRSADLVHHHESFRYGLRNRAAWLAFAPDTAADRGAADGVPVAAAAP